MHRWLIAWFPTHVGKKETEVNHVESSVGDHVRRCENKRRTLNSRDFNVRSSVFDVRLSSLYRRVRRPGLGLAVRGSVR